MEKTDIAIIGAGVIGLSISYELSSLGKEIITIEKHDSFGQETSSRNSEVIHAGLYYPKESLKAKTCIRGKTLLYELCAKNNIAYRKLGKLIVAQDKSGIEKIETIFKNALESGVDNLKIIDKNDVKKIEPDITAEKALLSPDTGIMDTHEFMKFLYKKAKSGGVNFAFSVEVIDIKKLKNAYKVIVKEPGGDKFSFEAKVVINSAGLSSDGIAKLVGIDPDKYSYKLHYCKGQYFRIRNPKKFSIQHLIYPPPTDIDLGIHVTPDLAGGLRLGPDAHYISEIDYNVKEEDGAVFLDSLQKFLPSLTLNDIISDTAGVRPKLQGEGEEFRDFIIRDEKDKGFPNFINLIGIESPGLTSSLAIAELVNDILKRS